MVGRVVPSLEVNRTVVGISVPLVVVVSGPLVDGYSVRALVVPSVAPNSVVVSGRSVDVSKRGLPAGTRAWVVVKTPVVVSSPLPNVVGYCRKPNVVVSTPRSVVVSGE